MPEAFDSKNFRSENLAGPHLIGSRCLFQLHVRPGTDTRALAAKVEKMGGLLSLMDGQVLLDLPHETIDAFGGMYLICKFIANQDRRHIPTSQELISINGSKLVQLNRPTFKFSPRQRLFLFCEKMLPALRMHEFQGIVFPVALDDPRSLEESNYLGNGFVLVPLDTKTLEELIALGPTFFRSALQVRANKLAQIIRRRPNALRPVGRTLLVSSLGDTTNFSWAHGLDGQQLTMVPTPLAKDALNIVLWSANGTDSIAGCALTNPENDLGKEVLHPLWSASTQAWHYARGGD